MPTPNTHYSPAEDVDSVEYSFTLGKPFIKFPKYPDDYRLTKYKNLGNSKRQSMFLYGYLPYINKDGNPDTARGNKGPYPLFFRDQVGMFLDARPGTTTRNYPPGSRSLYNPDGSQFTDQEMLDEWGCEFLGESRRRTDLIRWVCSARAHGGIKNSTGIIIPRSFPLDRMY